jgi:predicted histone-like DNA-binding protein
MARSVTYSVSPRINPRDKEAAPKFYAQAQARGDVSIREMAERIQSTCTVTKADVYAVLVALEDVIVEALQNGEIVRLGELGTFQLSLSGKGAETEEDYNVSLIKKAKINFRPGLTLSDMLSKLQFSKVDIKYAKEDAEGKDENTEEGGEDLTS